MAIFALTLMSGAYIGEIFRSGIQSVDKGQLEASRALGFSYGSSMRLVVDPQGIRRVLPALVNQFIALIKESSLVFCWACWPRNVRYSRSVRTPPPTRGNLSPLCCRSVHVSGILTIPLTHFVNWIDATACAPGVRRKKQPDDAAAA
jgi:polar amino acid transport system permease protein